MRRSKPAKASPARRVKAPTKPPAKRRKASAETSALEAQAALWYDGKSFTFDWTSWNFPNWISLLEPLRRRAVRVLEIGSFEGRSALFFLNHLPKSRLTCIDTFEGGEEHQKDDSSAAFMRGVERRFHANVEAFKPRVEVIKAASPSALAQLGVEGRRYDVAYIDGGHRAVEVYSDAALTWPLIAPGGLVIFDDYLWTEMPGPMNVPKPGIDAFLRSIKGQHRVVLRGYQIAIIKL